MLSATNVRARRLAIHPVAHGWARPLGNLTVHGRSAHGATPAGCPVQPILRARQVGHGVAPCRLRRCANGRQGLRQVGWGGACSRFPGPDAARPLLRCGAGGTAEVPSEVRARSRGTARAEFPWCAGGLGKVRRRSPAGTRGAPQARWRSWGGAATDLRNCGDWDGQATVRSCRDAFGYREALQGGFAQSPLQASTTC